MLKVPDRKLADSRKSVARPLLRRPKLEHKDTWHCINIDYPLVKVVQGCTIFDFVRASCDTVIILVLLFYTLELDYEDVVLVKPKHLKVRDDIVATTYPSLTKKEYTRIFNHTKKTLCIIIGIAAFIAVVEIPLAIFLFKAVQNQSREHMVMWTQISLVFIFFNFVAFTAFFVYSGKAGLILDNETWVSVDGANLRCLIYMNLLRVAVFDITKGAEVIFVNAFSKEITKLLKDRKSRISAVSNLAKIV